MSRPIPVDPFKWAEMVMALKERDTLRQENERLRKAGDELANDLFSRISMRSETPRTIKNWYAAKEVGDAK